MKKVEALIKPERLVDIREGLKAVDFCSMTNYEVWYRGSNKGSNDLNVHSNSSYDFVPKMKIELVIRDELVNDVPKIICNYGNYEGKCDERIFVSNIDDSIKIQRQDNKDFNL
jgi:nitrogen regulatory protein P-II 1